MTKENIIVYSKKFFELLSKKFENTISYKYKLLFLKNEKYNQYSINIAIDIDNTGSRNKIAFFTYNEFSKLDRKNQLKYMGNFYNAEILGKNETEFTIEEAEKDFLKVCDFNYLRDSNNAEYKENEEL